MANLRTSTLLSVLVSLGIVSGSTWSHAEWWKIYAPKDFEDCAVSAEQPGLTKDAKTKILSECDAKFAGRRKAGGGYTYYDFMQNRHFDIAGPNPTPEELKRMDQEYLGYLDDQRKAAIATAFAKQQVSQQPSPQPQQVSLMRPVPAPARSKAPQQSAALQKFEPGPPPRPPAGLTRARKEKACRNDALSCGWTKLTMTMQGLRQSLLRPAPKTGSRAER